MDNIVKRKKPAITGRLDSPFETIKRTDNEGIEYWSSRELAKVLEYDNYRNFVNVIDNAMIACRKAGINIEDHFVEANEMVAIGSGATRYLDSMYLSRYACLSHNSKRPLFKRNCCIGANYFCDAD